MREDVFVDAVGVDHRDVLFTGALGFHLGDGFVACASDALVGGDHYAADLVGFVERGQGEDHLDGGAVGIGYDVVVGAEDVGVDFGDDQLFGRIHSPVGGIVDYAAACCGE